MGTGPESTVGICQARDNIVDEGIPDPLYIPRNPQNCHSEPRSSAGPSWWLLSLWPQTPPPFTMQKQHCTVLERTTYVAACRGFESQAGA